MRASRGRCSQIRRPATLVLMTLKSPRYCAGASGLHVPGVLVGRTTPHEQHDARLRPAAAAPRVGVASGQQARADRGRPAAAPAYPPAGIRADPSSGRGGRRSSSVTPIVCWWGKAVLCLFASQGTAKQCFAPRRKESLSSGIARRAPRASSTVPFSALVRRLHPASAPPSNFVRHASQLAPRARASATAHETVPG